MNMLEIKSIQDEKMFKPIPKIAYERFKSSLCDHKWLHYLFHCSYCFCKDNINKKYDFYTPREWTELRTILPNISENRITNYSLGIRMPVQQSKNKHLL